MIKLLKAILIFWTFSNCYAQQLEQRVALVIGNSAYKFSPLKNPINDSKAIAKKLREYGFNVIEKEDLKQKQIASVVREFKQLLTKDSVAVFFYAGHGFQVKGVNYLPAVDAEIESEEDVSFQSLDVNKILDVMEESHTKMNLVFLDACRNNPFSRSFRSTADGLARVNAPSGTIISFATRPGSIASDGKGLNGLYTEHLLKNMHLQVPIEQVLKKVVSGVKQFSEGKQEPWMEGSIEGDFIFNNSPFIDPQEKKFWETIKSSEQLKLVDFYILTYPDGSFIKEALAQKKKLEKVENEFFLNNQKQMQLNQIQLSQIEEEKLKLERERSKLKILEDLLIDKNDRQQDKSELELQKKQLENEIRNMRQKEIDFKKELNDSNEKIKQEEQKKLEIEKLKIKQLEKILSNQSNSDQQKVIPSIFIPPSF